MVADYACFDIHCGSMWLVVVLPPDHVLMNNIYTMLKTRAIGVMSGLDICRNPCGEMK